LERKVSGSAIQSEPDVVLLRVAPSVKQEMINKKDSKLHPENGPSVVGEGTVGAGKTSARIRRPPVEVKKG